MFASMKLTGKDKSILNGDKGETLQKLLKSVVIYGEAFGAEELVEIQGASHQVISMGTPTLVDYYKILEDCISEGLKIQKPFSADPRPIDEAMVESGLLPKTLYDAQKVLQDNYENQLKALGLKDSDAFTCACYLQEVGNIPQKGSIIAWSESSAVVYANSVIGARTNRNSAGLDLMCNLIGKVPYYGLLTDEGRKADWLIEIKTEQLPNPQLLGSTIGIKVMEDVPYLIGLDRLFEKSDDQNQKGYLKDLGAAAAASGAVGLFHVENITPEALEFKRDLLKKEYKTFVIDDVVLQNTFNSYPDPWNGIEERPDICFLGCPHLDYEQLSSLVDTVLESLKNANQSKTALPAVFFSAPGVLKKYREKEFKKYEQARQAGLVISTICPLMFIIGQFAQGKKFATNSSKLRYYTEAKFFLDHNILDFIVSGNTTRGLS
jgi:predicted aconitase